MHLTARNRVQVKHDRLGVGQQESRVAHNNHAPVQLSVNRYGQEPHPEYVHALEKSN